MIDIAQTVPAIPTITIEDFIKIDLRVAEVLECVKVEKSDKLLNLRLSLGTEQRTVLSGIAEHYSPEEMIGKRVVLVLCGGNIDARILASVMVRELERDDRIASFRITSHDRPGLLGRVAGVGIEEDLRALAAHRRPGVGDPGGRPDSRGGGHQANPADA